MGRESLGGRDFVLIVATVAVLAVALALQVLLRHEERAREVAVTLERSIQETAGRFLERRGP